MSLSKHETTENLSGQGVIVWQEALYWGLVIGGLILAFWESASKLVHIWMNREEYSHGFFIPLITLYLLWLQKDQWLGGKGHWSGLVVVGAGAALLLMGQLATIHLVVHYGMVTVIIGAFIARYGIGAFRKMWMPLVFLYFMMPLPPFLHNQISLKMQLLSSKLGVGFIRICQIPVFLEGNVIDLGVYQLQVAEACNGLRYLFPLFSLSFLFACLYRGPIWQRWIIFLSALPLTILLNSFRIGVIGLLVNRWGISMAEGFLHDFEGWIVFMVCVGLLLVEIKLLALLSGNRKSLADLIPLPSGTSSFSTTAQTISMPKAAYGTLAILLVAVIGSVFLQQREEIIPARKSFLFFPMQMNEWHGQKDYLDKVYLDSLKLTDYLLAEYHSPQNTGPVNLLIAYYEVQRAGASAHSPRSCIPGGGWEIQRLEQHTFDRIQMNGQPLKLNRLVIAKGDAKQLVYYWFQQRGRNLTNEYLVKWFLFYDALTKNRTDGALVRLVTPVDIVGGLEKADKRLQAFLKPLVSVVPKYVPQ